MKNWLGGHPYHEKVPDPVPRRTASRAPKRAAWWWLPLALVILWGSCLAPNAIRPADESASYAPLAPGTSGSIFGVRSQSFYALPGQPFSFELSGVTGPATLVVEVGQKLPYRAAFIQSEAATGSAALLGPALAEFAVHLGGPTATQPLRLDPIRLNMVWLSRPAAVSGASPAVLPGSDTVSVTASGTGAASLPPLVLSPCPSGCSGVYPIAFRLTGSAGPSSWVTTYVTYVSEMTPVNRLRVVPTISLCEPPAQSLGSDRLSNQEMGRLQATLSGLAVSTAGDVNICPPTLAELARQSPSRLATLRSLLAAGRWQVLAAPYEPPPYNPDAGPAAGQAELNWGASVLSDLVPEAHSVNGWLEPIAAEQSDDFNLAPPPSVGFEILPEALIDQVPLHLKYTLTQPLRLGSSGTAILAEDSQLREDLLGGSSLVESEARAMADLGMIFFDQPSDPSPRLVTLDIPSSWGAGGPAIQSLLHQLNSSPILTSVSATAGLALFGPVASWPQAQLATPTGHRLAHSLTAVDAAVKTVLGLTEVLGRAAPPRERTAPQLDQLAAFRGSPSANRLFTTAFDRLLTGLSESIPLTEQRASLTSASQSLADLAKYISISHSRITLTSQAGNLPISVLNRLSSPLAVDLSLSSQKLIFVHGSSVDLTVERNESTEFIPVKSRLPGSFVVRVRLEAPDGQLISQTLLDVESTAISVMGIGLTAGASFLLLAWWATSAIKNKRARTHS